MERQRQRQKKALGANQGGKETSAGGAKINQGHIYYSLYDRPLSSGLSSLLDQALSKWEHHLSLAHHHAAEARKHREVLRSLQNLIPPGQRGRGGAA